MLQSKLFSKTSREAPKDEVSLNAILLTRAGYVDKLMAGVYTYLPLGLKVLAKIKQIVREEMDAVGGQEILMPVLSPKENWQKTGRWQTLDVLFKLKADNDKEYALGSTHEEIVTPLLQKFASSYKDLPVAVYQIQDKFRNEPRAKSGLLRGREFNMKDMYSFHANPEDLVRFYNQAKLAYFKVFQRCGLNAIIVEASGGSFSKYSHEFQVVTPYGEDIVIKCSSCDFAQNKEICELKTGGKCPNCSKKVEEVKAIEVGNIFQLNTKFTEAFNYRYADESGKLQPVYMGCYGIGPSRIMGTVAEISHDDKGLVWPENLTPFHVHLVLLDKSQAQQALELYQALTLAGYDVLFDDREVSAGIKLKDADLLGISVQLIIGEKNKGAVEMRLRKNGDSVKVNYPEVIKKLQDFYQK